MFRMLEGRNDAMPRYRKDVVEITDPEVIRTSGERFHPILVPSDDPSDAVEGKVFRIHPRSSPQPIATRYRTTSGSR
jgi:hypothetical protein